MRPGYLAGLALALLPGLSFGQTGTYLAVVVDPEVKLRAGPSDQFPETARLPQGSPLLVDHEEPNGWLAVLDPPGRMYSLSWVQGSFIDFDPTKPLPQTVVVDEPTRLAAGQIGLAQPLTHVRRTPVPAGTILTVVGPKVQFEGKSWYPVLPPAGDFRYVPKSSIRLEKAVTTAFTVRDSGSTPPGGELNPTNIGRTGPTAGTSGATSLPPNADAPVADPRSPVTTQPLIAHPLWEQAEAAERDGRYDDAERHYFQLARLMNESGRDHDVANLCYSRIHALREKRRAAAAGSLPPPSSSPSPPPAPRPTGSLLPPIGTNTSPSRPAGADSPRPPISEPRDDRPRWIGPGRLRPSALAIDGRRTYALESTSGTPLAYVVAGQGVDLERAVGRRVEVFGVSHTRTGLSRPYVVATAVEVVP